MTGLSTRLNRSGGGIGSCSKSSMTASRTRSEQSRKRMRTWSSRPNRRNRWVQRCCFSLIS
eukprot:6610698-Alexandrium_andersonii.AAC.1